MVPFLIVGAGQPRHVPVVVTVPCLLAKHLMCLFLSRVSWQNHLVSLFLSRVYCCYYYYYSIFVVSLLLLLLLLYFCGESTGKTISCLLSFLEKFEEKKIKLCRHRHSESSTRRCPRCVPALQLEGLSHRRCYLPDLQLEALA